MTCWSQHCRTCGHTPCPQHRRTFCLASRLQHAASALLLSHSIAAVLASFVPTASPQTRPFILPAAVCVLLCVHSVAASLALPRVHSVAANLSRNSFLTSCPQHPREFCLATCPQHRRKLCLTCCPRHRCTCCLTFCPRSHRRSLGAFLLTHGHHRAQRHMTRLRGGDGEGGMVVQLLSKATQNRGAWAGHYCSHVGSLACRLRCFALPFLGTVTVIFATASSVAPPRLCAEVSVFWLFVLIDPWYIDALLALIWRVPAWTLLGLFCLETALDPRRFCISFHELASAANYYCEQQWLSSRIGSGAALWLCVLHRLAWLHRCRVAAHASAGASRRAPGAAAASAKASFAREPGPVRP